MNNTLIRTAVCGGVCLLLAGLLAGCNEPVKQSKPTAGDSKKDAAKASADATAPHGATEMTVKPKVAADAETKKLGEPARTKTSAKPEGESVETGACDGGADVKVAKDLKGQPLADSLLDQWKRSHPEATKWVDEEKERHTLQPPADNLDLLKGGQGKGDTYGNFTPRDLETWQRETEKFAAEGSRIFHSGDELGSTVGVSCDMCHPHAANTHPETYPKYQTQLGRVVLLRDMINWCIQNPVRGKTLEPDSQKMRALEAYIMAQRKGVAMNYGKH